MLVNVADIEQCALCMMFALCSAPVPAIKMLETNHCKYLQISNSTTVHVRRPGNPKKWRARLLCEGIICDLALLTVDEEDFWSEDLMSLQFVDVPELQV